MANSSKDNWQVPVVTAADATTLAVSGVPVAGANAMLHRDATCLSKKIYVAAKFTERDRVRELYAALKEAGHTITYDWTVDEVARNELEACHAAQNDLAGVRDADVVVLLPHAYSRGAYVEFGYALALNKPIVIVGGCTYHSLSVFFHAPGTHWVERDDAVPVSIAALYGLRVEK